MVILESNHQPQTHKTPENMKKVVTKYIPATDTRGSRIMAKSGLKTASIPYPHELSGEECHKAAAVALCNRHGWPVDIQPTDIPRRSGYVFFVSNQ